MALCPSQLVHGNMVESGFISPQHLSVSLADATVDQTNVVFLSKTQHKAGVKLKDVGTLEPGKQYLLSQDPIPTPQSILDGSYLAAVENLHQNPDIVVIVPRLPKYCGMPSLPSIIFGVQGQPGPYVSDLVLDQVVVDNPTDLVFQDRVWKQTSLTVDWPGVKNQAEYIPCVDKENRALTRMQVARTVALRVHDVVMTGKDGRPFKWGHQIVDKSTKAWNLRKIDYQGLRLIAINYYRRTWIPVLGLTLDP